MFSFQSGVPGEEGLFMAFTVKKGMVLAPARRNKLETSGFDQTYYNEQVRYLRAPEKL